MAALLLAIAKAMLPGCTTRRWQSRTSQPEDSIEVEITVINWLTRSRVLVTDISVLLHYCTASVAWSYSSISPQERLKEKNSSPFSKGKAIAKLSDEQSASKSICIH
ncbi:hypothetical protein ACJ73_09341 [Blastomyces percursus]|uniref:Uncharacterized protein n=1 Tax=Blastomyces percursus TaxID=1658174 RepID=A0A1J9P999_9EURO|nr:hypothetical protein ACJ73_09341 [Blastomyces percursus]